MPLLANNSKRNKVDLIVAILMLALTMAALIVFVLNGFMTAYPILQIIFAAAIPLLSMILIILVIVQYSRKRDLRRLTEENLYRLGKVSFFPDSGTFRNRVAKIRKRNKKNTNQYLIVFSPTLLGEDKVGNPYVRKLNGFISEFLVNLLTVKKAYGKDKVLYAYARDHFCLYSFLPLNQTIELIDVIYNEIYRICDQNELKIYLSPHFGIYKSGRDELFTPSYNKAHAALQYAEMQFEEYALYEPNMIKEASLNEIQAIDRALKKKEFVVYYQPKYSISKHKVVGSEALIRWNSPKNGLLPPSKFVGTAELGGLIHKIDMYVFEQVIEDLKEMRRHDIELLPISINFSLYEFYTPDFIPDLERKVNQSGLPISLFQIEITETTSQTNNLLATSILKKLKDFGFKILMDDFGSGYSNLLNLNTLPVDTVKIDKSFIDGITLGKKNKEIVKCLISMCQANGFEIVAEGVENEEQVKVLKSANCDIIQGYYFSKPIPRDEFIKLLEGKHK